MSRRFTLMRHNASPGETAKFPTCQNQVHFLGLQSLEKIDAFEGEVRARFQNCHILWICAHTWTWCDSRFPQHTNSFFLSSARQRLLKLIRPFPPANCKN